MGEEDEAVKGLMPTSSSSSEVGDALTKENALSTLRRADTGKKLELLFATWDADHDGYIDIPDFAKGLQKMQPSTDEIHLEFVADAAVKALPALSADVQRVDIKGFKTFIDTLTKQMGQPFSLVSELLILCGLEMQTLPESGSALVKEIQERRQANRLQTQKIRELSQDSRMLRLFQYFNKSGTGVLSFSELTQMLWALRQGVSMRQSRAEAVDTMLLLDADSERAVSIVQFSRFVNKLGVLLHMDTRALANTMLSIAEAASSKTCSNDDSAISSSMAAVDPTAQVYETLADRKMHLLFELWDKDGDGQISFAELALGLRKLSPPNEPVTDTASDAAEAMLVFDVDSDQNLNRAEFARFVTAFCDGCEADFDTLSEFLILLAAMEDSPSEELAFLLAKDKIDRAIAGVDASWQSSSSQPPSQKRSPQKQRSSQEQPESSQKTEAGAADAGRGNDSRGEGREEMEGTAESGKDVSKVGDKQGEPNEGFESQAENS